MCKYLLWLIKVSASVPQVLRTKGVVVATFFLLFLLDSFDYLRITDGSNNTIGTYCGIQTGKSVRVFGTVALLTFHTDGSVQSRGFQLSFSFFSHSPGKLRTVSIVFTTLVYFKCYTLYIVIGVISRVCIQEGV